MAAGGIEIPVLCCIETGQFFTQAKRRGEVGRMRYTGQVNGTLLE